MVNESHEYTPTIYLSHRHTCDLSQITLKSLVTRIIALDSMDTRIKALLVTACYGKNELGEETTGP